MGIRQIFFQAFLQILFQRAQATYLIPVALEIKVHPKDEVFWLALAL
jgi:hypothetical protein